MKKFYKRFDFYIGIIVVMSSLYNLLFVNFKISSLTFLIIGSVVLYDSFLN
ncbi:Protein of unknown function [Leuconostoc citreum LBAE C10]|nr:Protein of unknown function [Leuconostoc citreum LBAE C10]